MEYFVTRDGRQEGPLSLDEINQRLSEGTLSPSDLGWTESMGDWKPLQDIPGVVVSIPGAPWGAEPTKPKGKGGLQTVLIILVVGLVIAGAVYGIMQLVGGESDTPPPADNNQTANNATDTNQTANNATQPPTVKIDPSPAGVITLTGHTNTITSLSFSPNGQFLVSGDAGGGLIIWNALTGAELGALSQKGAIKHILITPNNQLVFVLSDQQMAAWDSKTKKIVSQAKTPPTGFANGALHPVRPDLLFAIGGTDGRMDVWGTTGMKHYTQRGHTNSLNAICFSPGGSHILTGGIDNTIRLWVTQGGKPESTLSQHIGPITGLDVRTLGTANGIESRRFVSSSMDGSVIAWKWSLAQQTGISQIQPFLRMKGHDGGVRCVAINPRFHDLAASGGHDKTLIYWNLANTAEPLFKRFQAHAAPISCIAYASDGFRVATGSEDRTIKIWPKPWADQNPGP